MHASKILFTLPLLATAVMAAPTSGFRDGCNRGYYDHRHPDDLVKIHINRPYDSPRGHRGYDNYRCRDDCNDCYPYDDRYPHDDHYPYGNNDCYCPRGRGGYSYGRKCPPKYLAGSKFNSHVEKDETDQLLSYLAVDKPQRGGWGDRGGVRCKEESHTTQQLAKRDPTAIKGQAESYDGCHYPGEDDRDNVGPAYYYVGNRCDDDFDCYEAYDDECDFYDPYNGRYNGYCYNDCCDDRYDDDCCKCRYQNDRWVESTTTAATVQE